MAATIADDDAVGGAKDGDIDAAAAVFEDQARAGGQALIERFSCSSFIYHSRQ